MVRLLTGLKRICPSTKGVLCEGARYRCEGDVGAQLDGSAERAEVPGRGYRRF